MLRQARLGALLYGGMVSGALLVASSPAAAAQIVDDGAVLDATTTEGSPSESQPGWTLERLVSEVAARNPRIRSQSAAAKAAGYDVAAARWQFFPAPAIQAETSGSDRQLIASVSQPIYSFGRLESDLKAAKSRASLAQMRVEEAQYVLSFRVLDLFGQLLSTSRSLDVFRQDVTRLNALEEMIGRRVTAGVSAPVPAPTTQSAPAPAVATKAPAAAVIAPEQVIVTEGDSLARIAIRRGIAVEAMIAANPQLSNPTRLYPGDKVNLPKAAGAPTPAQ